MKIKLLIIPPPEEKQNKFQKKFWGFAYKVHIWRFMRQGGMRCPWCGGLIKKTWKYCEYCGRANLNVRSPA